MKDSTCGGRYVQDLSGLWHYTNDQVERIGDAINDVLITKPKEPVWFWWNDSPAPVLLVDDKPDLLYRRWSEWRESNKAGSQLGSLLGLKRQ